MVIFRFQNGHSPHFIPTIAMWVMSVGIMFTQPKNLVRFMKFWLKMLSRWINCIFKVLERNYMNCRKVSNILWWTFRWRSSGHLLVDSYVIHFSYPANLIFFQFLFVVTMFNVLSFVLGKLIYQNSTFPIGFYQQHLSFFYFIYFLYFQYAYSWLLIFIKRNREVNNFQNACKTC